MAEALLELEGVHTHIGRYHILQGVDLRVPEGQVTMLLGRNGAGKSTTLRTVMGLWRASGGRVRFGGEEITGRPTPDIARLGIAYVPEQMGIFGNLSVKENIVLAARAGVLGARRGRRCPFPGPAGSSRSQTAARLRRGAYAATHSSRP